MKARGGGGWDRGSSSGTDTGPSLERSAEK